MDALQNLADVEWRRINHVYEHLDSDTFLMLYDLWMESYTRGYRAGATGP
jgi:hypothetical protein